MRWQARPARQALRPAEAVCLLWICQGVGPATCPLRSRRGHRSDLARYLRPPPRLPQSHVTSSPPPPAAQRQPLVPLARRRVARRVSKAPRFHRRCGGSLRQRRLAPPRNRLHVAHGVGLLRSQLRPRLQRQARRGREANAQAQRRTRRQHDSHLLRAVPLRHGQRRRMVRGSLDRSRRSLAARRPREPRAHLAAAPPLPDRELLSRNFRQITCGSSCKVSALRQAAQVEAPPRLQRRQH